MQLTELPGYVFHLVLPVEVEAALGASTIVIFFCTDSFNMMGNVYDSINCVGRTLIVLKYLLTSVGVVASDSFRRLRPSRLGQSVEVIKKGFTINPVNSITHDQSALRLERVRHRKDEWDGEESYHFERTELDFVCLSKKLWASLSK